MFLGNKCFHSYAQITNDFQFLLEKDTNAFSKIVDLNLFFIDKLAQLESNLSQPTLSVKLFFFNQENLCLKQKLARTEDATKILYFKIDGLPESESQPLINVVATAQSQSRVSCTTADRTTVRPYDRTTIVPYCLAIAEVSNETNL